MLLGLRAKSGELIVVDGETKELEYTRVVKRVLEEQRWSVDNLEWVTKAVWSRARRAAMRTVSYRSSM